ncbi:MBL fold metallo-hydrolase [Streptomyces daliensis]|uniref:MBL fold metallo-hydrolase n=1 Tax=Streptomyces daliensis TaxID=299421 RepID=A0A8T4IY05_9ACTN|nr:MBL fold metallo-hydrolase [Streptomyces daliensis]
MSSAPAERPPRATGRWRLLPDAFGAAPYGERWERVQRSPQFRDGQFRNEQPARTMSPGALVPLLRESLRRETRLRRSPAQAPPLVRPAFAERDEAPGTGLRVTWLGHASVLVEIDGHRVLFDPVWGERCSPFAFAGPRRFHPMPVPLSEVGPLDAVVISHDHYDHLDLPTIRALARTGTVFAVPLGVGAHLEHWGVPEARLRELDWHESAHVGGLTLTATPGRHFCGRGLSRRALTLWASWVVSGPVHRVFHSGDTGYFPGFAKIGAEYGPFDATMIQIGAYSEHWPDIHMTPEEGVTAHLDLAGPAASQPGAGIGPGHGVLLPIHWGTFNLAPHPWEEPVERTVAAAEESGVRVAVPRPGESYEPAGALPAAPWWKALARRPEPLATGPVPEGGRSGTMEGLGSGG